MSRNCLAGPTRKDEEPMESTLPSVYLTAKGVGLPRKMEPMDERAERERRQPNLGGGVSSGGGGGQGGG